RGGPHQAFAATLERASVMLRSFAQDRRLLDRLKALTDNGELLHDAAKIGAVVGRLLEFLEFLERRFHALADHGHFAANVAGQLIDGEPQRIESLGRVIACFLLVWFESLALVRHGVSYRSSPMLWLRPRVRLRSMSRARLSLSRT